MRGNGFAKRLWRSVNHDDIYPHTHKTSREGKTALTGYFEFYDNLRSHQNFDRAGR